MNIISKAYFTEPMDLYVEYTDGMKGRVDLADIINHDDYKNIKREINVKNITIADDGDILIDGKVKLCKNATYGILEMKAQMRKLGLEL